VEKHKCGIVVAPNMLNKKELIKMIERNIHYKSGYKHQLVSTYKIRTTIFPPQNIEVPGFIELSRDGLLIVKEKYAWDGATAIIDTKHNRNHSA
jgi:hypothetical protein